MRSTTSAAAIFFNGVLPIRTYSAALWLSTLPLAIALSACGTSVYDKPGLTYSEWRRDDAECRLAAAQGPADTGAYRRCLRERGYRVPEE